MERERGTDVLLVRNIIIIHFIIRIIFIITDGLGWPAGLALSSAVTQSFALIIVNLGGSGCQAGRQAGRSPGLLSSVQSAHLLTVTNQMEKTKYVKV